ncbi:MAG TPA: biotin--[acetyl-CoA-carboxylase] ligase [Steroidobacteraceae bacterium]|nr:biotin--[acetyl-CoA-carboxylase] ligase [Steroidobacteraceae bacterium]
MTTRSALVRLLADGAPHCDAALAHTLNLEVAALAAEFAALADWGLVVEAAGDGAHRLSAPLDLIDAHRLTAALGSATRGRLASVAVHDDIPSTNAELLADSRLAPGHVRTAIAEHQSAGRGRRGRSWLQPFGSGICLSLAWLFPAPPAALGALSLAAGVATLRALAAFGATGLSLKWPNDVLRDGKKLGGILSELRLDASGPAYVVIGVGLNVRLPAALKSEIAASGGVAPADLAGVAIPSRTALAAALVDALVAALVEFESLGFGPFHAEWSRADALKDRSVRIEAAEGVRQGIARGVGPDGALRVEIGARIESLASGEVTLRAVA